MPNNEIVRRETVGPLMIDGKPHHITIVVPTASNQIQQLPDERPAQYTTQKSRGIPDQPLPKLRPPSFNLLTVALAAITGICFLVAASMFSISLNSYSNSVDRTHRQRSEPTHYNF